MSAATMPRFRRTRARVALKMLAATDAFRERIRRILEAEIASERYRFMRTLLIDHRAADPGARPAGVADRQPIIG